MISENKSTQTVPSLEAPGIIQLRIPGKTRANAAATLMVETTIPGKMIMNLLGSMAALPARAWYASLKAARWPSLTYRAGSRFGHPPSWQWRVAPGPFHRECSREHGLYRLQLGAQPRPLHRDRRLAVRHTRGWLGGSSAAARPSSAPCAPIVASEWQL